MQAMLLAQLGRGAEGVPLALEADTLARSHRLISLADQMIAPVLAMLGASAADPVAPARSESEAPAQASTTTSGGGAQAAVAARASTSAGGAAPRAAPVRSAEEEKQDYLFALNLWKKLSWFQRLRTRKPELPSAMRADWRRDPILKGRFHKDAQDDILVIVHDGHPGITGRAPEAVWVRVTGRRGTAWIGTMMNQPHQLQSMRKGTEVLFGAPGRHLPLVHVTPKYLEERTVWTVGPCSKCGLTETFSPPSELLEDCDASADVRAQLRRVQVPCPLCDGTQILTRA
jgi:hypothetical protein